MRKKTYEISPIAATDAVMKFASLWDYEQDATCVHDPQQVQGSLMDAAFALGAQDFEMCFRTLDRDALVADQLVLRGWLNQIVRFKKLTVAERTALLTEIQQWAVQADITSSLVVKQGRFAREYRAHFNSVRALIGEVLTHLPQLQPHAGTTLLQGDVLQCSVCKTFYVISRSDDTGVCSPRCRAARARSK